MPAHWWELGFTLEGWPCSRESSTNPVSAFLEAPVAMEQPPGWIHTSCEWPGSPAPQLTPETQKKTCPLVFPDPDSRWPACSGPSTCSVWNVTGHGSFHVPGALIRFQAWVVPLYPGRCILSGCFLQMLLHMSDNEWINQLRSQRTASDSCLALYGLFRATLRVFMPYTYLFSFACKHLFL